MMSLGLEDGRIQNGAMLASSDAGSKHKAYYGRLNLSLGSGNAGAWSARTSDANQWLQIDFGRETTVTKVLTQGRQDANQWVTRYTMSYNPTRSSWTWVDVMTHGRKTVCSHLFLLLSILMVLFSKLSQCPYLIRQPYKTDSLQYT